jgi:hypothetical protein
MIDPIIAGSFTNSRKNVVHGLSVRTIFASGRLAFLSFFSSIVAIQFLPEFSVAAGLAKMW